MQLGVAGLEIETMSAPEAPNGSPGGLAA